MRHHIIGRSTLAMGKKKRKQEKLGGDSSSSADAKLRRRSCCQDDGPSGSEHLEGSDRNVLIQLLRDSIQGKVNTDERLRKLEERLNNTDERLRKLKKRLKNMTKKYRVLREGLEGHTKELIDQAKEDLRKEMADRVDEQLKLKIQELQYNASSSQRSPPHQSQTTRFRLCIKSRVSKVVYKGKDIRTDDGKDEIHVILYDGGSEIAPDHRLASVEVQLVVVKAEFSERCQGFWSKEEFKKSLETQPEGITWLVKDGRFPLVGGKGSHKGAVIIENSKRKDVKLGVMIVGDTEERVLEGLSNTFRVQEAKTEKCEKSKKIAAKDTLHNSSQLNQIQGNGEGLAPNANVQPYFSQTQPMQHEREKSKEFVVKDTLHNSSQLNQIQGNGLAPNANVQPYFSETPPMQHEREKSKEFAVKDTLHNSSQLNQIQGNGLALSANFEPYFPQTQPMQREREKSKEFAPKDTLHNSSQLNQIQGNGEGLALSANIEPYFPQTQPNVFQILASKPLSSPTPGELEDMYRLDIDTDATSNGECGYPLTPEIGEAIHL